MIKETIYFTPQDLDDWKNKTLLKQWKEEYPNLIPDHMFNIFNARKALNTYVFGELFTGIQFAKQGYSFLYEPWIENFLLTESQGLKDLQVQFQTIFIKQAGKELFDYITNTIKTKINKGQPDLFVYNNSGCFFVEVKRKNECLESFIKLNR